MGSDGVLIGVGSVEIGVLIGVYGDRVLTVWVSFQWGFDKVDWFGGHGFGFCPWVVGGGGGVRCVCSGGGDCGS